MFYLLNIGNTHTEIACADSCGKIKLLSKVETDSLQLPDFGGSIVAVASVVPAKTDLLKKAVHSDRLFVLNASTAEDLDFSCMERPSSIGSDRIANALALLDLEIPLPAAVIDAGSALTLEVVDEKHRFVGGAIAPGRALMREALFHGTAQLPEGVPLLQTCPASLGHSTVSSIAFGVDNGFVGIAREWLQRVKNIYPDVSVVVTGGDSKFIAEAIPDLRLMDEDFTFCGIRAGLLHSNFANGKL